MNIYRIFVLLLALSVVLGCTGKKNVQNGMSEQEAQRIIYESLKDSSAHNVVGQSAILRDKDQIVEYAELVLFEFYGKENIENQKPYNVFNIDDYWLIKGSLKDEEVGGVFLIIIDSIDGTIIRMSHEK